MRTVTVALSDDEDRGISFEQRHKHPHAKSDIWFWDLWSFIFPFRVRTTYAPTSKILFSQTFLVRRAAQPHEKKYVLTP